MLLMVCCGGEGGCGQSIPLATFTHGDKAADTHMNILPLFAIFVLFMMCYGHWIVGMVGISFALLSILKRACIKDVEMWEGGFRIC